MHCMFAKHSHLYFPEAHVTNLQAHAHENSGHSSRRADCDIGINLQCNTYYFFFDLFNTCNKT